MNEMAARRIPAPLPEKNETLFHIHEYAVLGGDALERQETYRYPHAKAKWVYYLLREGPPLAWRKVKASWMQRAVAEKRQVLLLAGDADGRKSVAVAPLDLPGLPWATIHRDHIAAVPLGRDAGWCLAALRGFFEREPDKLTALYHYSPFSGLGSVLKLEEVLAAEGFENGRDNSLIPAQAPIAMAGKKNMKSRGFGPQLFLVGAGFYTYAYVLPFLRGMRRHTVVDLNPLLAAAMCEKFGFKFAETSYSRAFERLRDLEKPVVVVATYHSTHVDVAQAALEANSGARIFMEKPPVTTKEQLKRLLTLREKGAFIEIGYNRRHAAFVRQAKNALEKASGPITMTCIVKEKHLPLSHWYYWPTQGTRITGNLSHWIDLGVYLIPGKPVGMNLLSSSERFCADEAAISIAFDDGSQLNLVATDRGNPLRGIQEFIDLRREDITVRIEDFLRMTIQWGGRQVTRRSLLRDKGHRAMYRNFAGKCRKGGQPGYPNEDLATSSVMYLDVAEALLKLENSRQQSIQWGIHLGQMGQPNCQFQRKDNSKQS